MKPSTFEKITQEARLVGLSFFEELKGTKNIYTFDTCGHTQTICTSKIRLNQFHCKTCFIDKLKSEAKNVNLTLVKQLKGTKNLYRFNECGHHKELINTHVRNGSFQCDQCLIEKDENHAQQQNLTLIKRLSGVKNLYKCQCCGNEQLINRYHVSTGTFQCHVCHPTYATKESGIYLLSLTDDKNFSWLKLGVSRDVKRRIKDYQLINVSVRILSYHPTETNQIAVSIEKELHRIFLKQRIDPDFMKRYMKSGFSECYPASLESTLSNTLSSHF